MKKRRIVVFLLCLILLVTGCGKGKSKEQGSVNGGVIDGNALSKELANYVYKAEELKDVDGDSITSSLVKDGRIYIMSTIWNNGEDNVTYDTSDEAVLRSDVEESTEDNAEAADSEADVPTDEYEYNPGTVEVKIECRDTSGKILYEYSDIKPGDCGIYALEVGDDGSVYYIFDEYASEKNDYVETYSINCIGTDGNVKWVSPIDSSVADGNYFYAHRILADSDVVSVITSVGIFSFDNNGAQTGFKKNEKLNELSGIIRFRDGRIGAVIYGEENATINTIDIKEAVIGEPIAMPFNMYSYNFSEGCGLYDIILSGQQGVYGFNIGDEKPTKIIDFMASDLNTTYISNISFVDSDMFYGSFYDDGTNVYRMYKFTKVDPSTVAAKKTIVLGGIWISSDVRRTAIEFNRSSDQYRIVLKDYSSEDFVDYDTMLQTINNDIISGNMPDIMLLTTELTKYLNMGIFADLNEFINNDSQINRDDYLTNVFDATTFDGKLVAIIPSFYVQTLSGKTSLIGDRNSWSIKEFNDFINSQDTSTPLGLMSKADFLNMELMAAYDDFIDRGNAEAKFDTQEFIDVLKATDKYPVEIDWNSIDDDYWNDYDTYYRDDTYVLSMSSLYSYSDASTSSQTTFGEPVTYIGYPVSEGTGNAFSYEFAVAINDKSGNKDGAWNFVKQFLGDDFQKNQYSFPIKKSVLDDMAVEAMKPLTYIDEETGEQVEYNDTYYINGMEIELSRPTQADIDKINAVLSSTTRIASYETNITNIIAEEAASYFNGQKSAEEVAKIIQGRVQLYLNENN